MLVSVQDNLVTYYGNYCRVLLASVTMIIMSIVRIQMSNGRNQREKYRLPETIA